MSFKGDEGSFVTLSNAKGWTEKHRKANPNAKRAYFFGREKIEALLKQEGACGIRIYHGIGDDDQANVILVACTENEANQIPENAMNVDPGDFKLLEIGIPCPPNCPPENSEI